jgi:hypothetical protein
LTKYDLVDVSKPSKLPNDKVDFYNGNHTNVWQIIVTTGMPLNQYVTMQGLRAALNIAEDYIVVRSANEPIELEANDDAFNSEVSAKAQKDGLKPASKLSTDRSYDDAEQPLVVDVFGDEYNKKLLDYLRNVADDRVTDHYEAPAPLFSWIDMDKAMANNEIQADDFNDRFDTPKPVSKGKGKDQTPVDPVFLGSNGNFDDGTATKVKIMIDNKGKREAISAPRARLKAEKVR